MGNDDKNPTDDKNPHDELPRLSAPALRALATIHVTRRSQLAKFTEADLLALHGFGPKSIRQLREAQVQLCAE